MDSGTVISLLTLAPQVFKLLKEVRSITGSSDVEDKLYDIAVALLERGGPAYNDMLQLHAVVNGMVTNKRNPTEAEWQLLQIESDDLHKQIQDFNFSGEEMPENT